MARDFTHLDHDGLVSLGITATGHRKRILRLVAHIRRTEARRANQKADLPHDYCQSVSLSVSSSEHGHSAASPTGPMNLDAIGNSSTPNRATMLTDSDSSRSVVKPVPKPRTVFNRRRTAPVHFCPRLDPAPPPHRRLSQESICFTLLEGLTSGDTPTPDGTSDLKDQPSPPSTPSRAQRRRPSRSLSLSDAGRLLPPVPPRMNRGVPPAMYQGSLPSSSSSSGRTEQNQTPPVTSSPGSLDHSRLCGSSPSGLSRGDGMEMVSNEIYWGASPGSTSGVKTYCRPQLAPPTPPRQAPDRNPERNR